MGFLYRKFLGGSETALEDVARNLGYILSARRGAATFLPNFGLTSTGFRTGEEMLNTFREEVLENIRLYEPRVEVLKVEEEYDDDSGRPRLVISIRLKGSSEQQLLILDPRSRGLELTPVGPKRLR